MSEEINEEMIKKEIEQLPEEVHEIEEETEKEEIETEKPQPPPETKKQPSAPPTPPPSAPQPPKIEDLIEEFRKRREAVKEILSFAKEISEASPTHLALASELLDRMMSQQTYQQIQQPQQIQTVERVVEKPVPVKEPVPVVPEELKERIENIETRLDKIDEINMKLDKYDKIVERVTALSTSTVSLASEIERLRSELEKVRQEQKEAVEKLKEGFMVVTKTRIKRPDGVEVEEYDWHPKLKYFEKQADFTFNTLGPAILQEIRLARADISTGLNRIISIFEAALLPELRKRAPKIAEDIEERMKKLVGSLTPEERTKELEELERKVSTLIEKEVEKR
jgi:uncharacterized phage infection (PIP) family protein YhgE